MGSNNYKKKYKYCSPSKQERRFWRLMERTESIGKSDLDGSEEAKRISDIYKAKGRVSNKDKSTAAAICAQHKKKRVKRPIYLYAIAVAGSVKIGISVDPRNRLSEIQTSQPEKAELIWKRYAAMIYGDAYRKEKELHEYLSEYHIRGEWFSIDCLDKAKSWRDLNETAEQENFDSSALLEIHNRGLC